MAIVAFAVVFGTLGVQNHRNFGTIAYDMGIYDQAIWLLSRFGRTFMSVRGLDVWGHHFNPILYLFVPLAWLGGGPGTWYVIQAAVVALGAAPVYLIARERLRNAWVGLAVAIVYLMYVPTQFVTWAMFHPETLAITPFLFAWWFAMTRRWRWYAAMVFVCLLIREDLALVLMMLSIALAIVHFHRWDRRTVLRAAASTFVVSALWYLVTTRWVIPHFNHGRPPFYIKLFYGRYGGDSFEVVQAILRHPDRVVADMFEKTRKTFYWQLLSPLAGLPLLGPAGLLMAAPQLLAATIGDSPYARMIVYQYTALLIAPLLIATVEGLRVLWNRRPIVRASLIAALLTCTWVANVKWSPSPVGNSYGAWAVPSPRHQLLREALALVPADASVSTTYFVLPQISHRRFVYNWPNPFIPDVWGDMDCVDLPDPQTVQYVVLDSMVTSAPQRDLVDAMTAPGGPFVQIYEREGVQVLKRVGTSAAVDVQPQADSCRGPDGGPAAAPPG